MPGDRPRDKKANSRSFRLFFEEEMHAAGWFTGMSTQFP